MFAYEFLGQAERISPSHFLLFTKKYYMEEVL